MLKLRSYDRSSEPHALSATLTQVASLSTQLEEAIASRAELETQALRNWHLRFRGLGRSLFRPGFSDTFEHWVQARPPCKYTLHEIRLSVFLNVALLPQIQSLRQSDIEW